MALTKTPMTEEEFMRLPDDGHKHELVNGEVKIVPASFEHNVIGAHIIALLTPYARGRGVIASSQAGFRMTNRNIRCPDVSYTQKARLTGGKPSKSFGDVAPDLCIEIISSSEDPKEMQQKLEEYFDSGARQVWHLYPETQRAIIYTSPTESTVKEANEEIDGGDILPGFRCRVAELFDIGLE